MFHSYDSSPCSPGVQYARLHPLLPLLRAGLSFVVYGEDALAIVHRVPVCLYTQLVLMEEHDILAASQLICASSPYAPADLSGVSGWNESIGFPASSAAVGTFTESGAVYLLHTDEDAADKTDHARDIVLVPSAFFHWDIQDESKTCLNPEPPNKSLAAIRFPTAAAFCDSIADTILDPQIDRYDRRLYSNLTLWLSYLSSYTFGDKEGCVEDSQGVKTPAYQQLLDSVKPENRPYLERRLGSAPRQTVLEDAMERAQIMEARMTAMGAPFVRPRMPPIPALRKLVRREPRGNVPGSVRGFSTYSMRMTQKLLRFVK